MPVWSASSSASTFGCGGCCRLLYLRGVSPGVGGLGGFSVAYSLFSSVGKFAGPPRLEVLVRILPPASGRSFIGAPQRGSCCSVDCCLACPRAGVWRSSVRWRVATRVLMVAGFPLHRAGMSAPSHIPWPFLDCLRFCLVVRF